MFWLWMEKSQNTDILNLIFKFKFLYNFQHNTGLTLIECSFIFLLRAL